MYVAVVDCVLLPLVLGVNPIHVVSSTHGSHFPLKAFALSYLQLTKNPPVLQGQLQLSCPGNIIPSATTHLDLC